MSRLSSSESATTVPSARLTNSCDAISMICSIAASIGCAFGRLAGYLARIFPWLIALVVRVNSS